jgi:short-subunit dehydrogenase
MQDAFGESEHVTSYAVDLSDRDATTDAIHSIRATHGPILYLINNAGVNIKNGINSLSLQEMDYSLQVNAIAPLMLMQTVLPDMEERGFGRIINVTSGASLNCFPEYAAYSSSKGIVFRCRRWTIAFR